MFNWQNLPNRTNDEWQQFRRHFFLSPRRWFFSRLNRHTLSSRVRCRGAFDRLESECVALRRVALFSRLPENRKKRNRICVHVPVHLYRTKRQRGIRWMFIQRQISIRDWYQKERKHLVTILYDQFNIYIYIYNDKQEKYYFIPWDLIVILLDKIKNLFSLVLIKKLKKISNE